MKSYTFILQDPSEEYPKTERFMSGTIASAISSIMRNKKLQGFKIVEAYCGSKSGKVTQMGFVTYEFLAGRVVKFLDKFEDEPAHPTEFDGLLGEVDEACSKKRTSHAE